MAMTANSKERICILVDIDSFDIQVCQKYLYPETKGKVCVVTYSSEDRNRLAAVSYEAKSYGIVRNDRLSEAKLKCPDDLVVLRYPKLHPENPDDNKPDMELHRKTTRDIVKTALEFCAQFDDKIRPVFEYSSCDEFFLDATALLKSGRKELLNNLLNQDSFVQAEQIDKTPYKFLVEDSTGSIRAKDWASTARDDEYEYELKLFQGLQLAAKVIEFIKLKIGLEASAGIGPNKLLTKLACGLNKPKSLTLVLQKGFGQMSSRIPIPSIPGLGGSAGKAIMERLAIDNNHEEGVEAYMSDLMSSLTLDQIANLSFGEEDETKGVGVGIRKIGTKKAENIYKLVRGIDETEIRYNIGPKSIWEWKEKGAQIKSNSK